MERLKERGNQLFTSHLTSKKNQLTDKNKIELINYLIDFFTDKVAPMEMKGQGTFAANRLAHACTQIAEDTNLTIKDIDSIIEKIFEIYNNMPIGMHLVTGGVSQSEAIQATSDIHEELEEKTKKLTSNLVFDLIEDVPNEELDVEGKRVRGLLPSNFDSLNDNPDDFEKEIEPEVVAIVEYDANNNIVILCPKCNSTNLVLESVDGSCLDCDCEFVLPLNINDSIDDSNYNFDKFSLSGNIMRINGEKKNRGIITEGKD